MRARLPRGRGVTWRSCRRQARVECSRHVARSVGCSRRSLRVGMWLAVLVAPRSRGNVAIVADGKPVSRRHVAPRASLEKNMFSEAQPAAVSTRFLHTAVPPLVGCRFFPCGTVHIVLPNAAVCTTHPSAVEWRAVGQLTASVQCCRGSSGTQPCRKSSRTRACSCLRGRGKGFPRSPQRLWLRVARDRVTCPTNSWASSGRPPPSAST